MSGTKRRVYRAVRVAGHGRLWALRCVFDVHRGSWSARDAGELRAQASLLGEIVRKG